MGDTAARNELAERAFMNKDRNQVGRMLVLLLQIGLTMLTAVFMCIGIAYLINRFFGLDLMVWFIILGIVSGFRATYILIKRYIGL